MYGLVIDALESVRIVTAEGNVVEASPHQNQDLFWGIRGAGANFGIITSATYKVHRLRNQGNIFTVDFTFPTAELSSQFFKAASDMGRDLPDEMAGNAFISFNSKTNQVCRLLILLLPVSCADDDSSQTSRPKPCPTGCTTAPKKPGGGP